MPPARIFLSVAMDEILRPVVSEMMWARKMIAITPQRPAIPVTHPSLRYMITPRMVKSEGVKTPENAPNFFAFAILGRLMDLTTQMKR